MWYHDRVEAQIKVPVVYESRINQGTTQNILLLHGFTQTGSKIKDLVLPLLGPDVSWVAPNAPFPVPIKTETGYVPGFSWYFYEAAKDSYYISMEPAQNYCLQLLESLGWLDSATPLTLLGFSQGGYLAPFLAGAIVRNQTGSNAPLKQVIGVGCRLLAEDLPSEVSFRIDGIHGSLDQVVSAKEAEESFPKVIQTGDSRGKFILVPESGHRIDGPMREAIRSVIFAHRSRV